MTNQQRNEKIIKAIEEATAKALVSKKKARELLISEGIYTAKGKLRAEFGGMGRDGCEIPRAGGWLVTAIEEAMARGLRAVWQADDFGP